MFVARRTLFRQALAVGDTVTLSVAFVASYLLVGRVFQRHFVSFKEYRWLLAIIIPSWLVCLRAFGLYASASYVTARLLAARLIRGHLAASLVLLSAMYLTKSEAVSRLLVQTFVAVAIIALLLQKFTLKASLERFRSRDFVNRGRVLLVGTPDRVVSYMEYVGAHTSSNVEIVGFLDTRELSHNSVEVEGSHDGVELKRI
jgi:FlaA1/EpsC-like NDP-sugar epimerase